MKLLKNGKCILKPEITNISEHGFWLFFGKEEFFLPYDEYPWFKDAKVSSILNIKLFHKGHLYWPDLDVDLTFDILKNPERYPLTYHDNKS